MSACVVSLGSYISFSIIDDNNLITHKSIKDLSSLTSYLYDQDIDRLLILVQGLPISELTDDSYLISELIINRQDIPIVIKDSDQIFFTDIATILKIKDVEVYSYTDYIAEKFSRHNSCIVVDTYIDDYGIFYIEKGVIKDFSKVSRLNLRDKLSKFKSMYDCPVFNSQKFGLSSKSILNNFELLKDSQMLAIDFLNFCITREGKHLVSSKNSRMDFLNKSDAEVKNEPDDLAELSADSEPVTETSSLSTNFDEDEELVKELVEEFGSLPSEEGKKYKQRYNEVVRSKKETEVNTKLEKIVSVCMIIFVGVILTGLVITFMFKGTDKNLIETIKTKEKTLSNIQDSKKNSDKITSQILDVLSSSKGVDVERCTCTANSISLTISSADKNSVSNCTSLLSEKYEIVSEKFDDKDFGNSNIIYMGMFELTPLIK